MASFLNNLKLYAATKSLTVAVKDAGGAPVEGAQVSFGILNYCDIFPAAVMVTGAGGTVRLTCGLGSINIHVKKGDLFCERMVYTPDGDRVEIVLERESPVPGQWEDFVSTAPKDQIVSAARPTEEQKALGLKKTAAANEKREKRTEAMFHRERAEAVVAKYGYSREIFDLLFESRGNLDRLLAFLEDGEFQPKEKEALLLTLSAKDRRDVDPEVLREALACSRDYEAPEEIYFPYIVCPRVFNEPLRLCRRFILETQIGRAHV